MRRVAEAAVLLALAIPVGSCDQAVPVTQAVSCSVVAAIDATDVLPGDTLTLTGGPFTTTWDTVVRIGGVDADILDVARDQCPACDVCRSDNGCTTCGVCDACTDLCAVCVESVAARVPAVAPGEHAVVLFNRFGASEPITIAIGETDTDVPLDTDTDVPLDTDTDAETDVALDTDLAVDTDVTGDTDASDSDRSDTDALHTDGAVDTLP